MATADVARDLDRLRQALGDDKINYVGYSYGSYLGITYANLFPRRIRTLVVDGVVDPIAWATGAAGESATAPVTQRIGSAVGGQATLGEFFRLCDAGGPDCAFAGDSAARFAALAALLRAGPIQVTDPTTGATSPFTYADLVINAFGSMYSSSSWPALADLLAFIEAQASPAEVGLQLQALREEAGLKKKGEFPAYANAPEWFPAVMCTDSDNPDSFAAWSRAAAESETQAGYLGPPWIWVSSVCAVWPGRDADRYTGPFNRATANPVLVVGNQFDPATRYAGAVKVNGLLPGSSLPTVHGWGHTSMFLSSCADAIVSRYLLEMATPPPGTVCEQDVVPFAEGPASLQTGEGAAAVGMRTAS